MNRCDRVDLRGAFDLDALFAPADADDDDQDEASHPPAEQPDPADAAGGDEPGESDEAPDNPELKRLHDEAARHRVRANEAEGQVAALSDQVRSLQLRLVFNEVAAIMEIFDTDAAWKLAHDDLRTVGVDDDGSMDTNRVGQITAHIAKRYPYLVAAPAPTPEDQALQDRYPALAPSGRSTNRRRRPIGSGATEQQLAKKFPALRRR